MTPEQFKKYADTVVSNSRRAMYFLLSTIEKYAPRVLLELLESLPGYPKLLSLYSRLGFESPRSRARFNLYTAEAQKEEEEQQEEAEQSEESGERDIRQERERGSKGVTREEIQKEEKEREEKEGGEEEEVALAQPTKRKREERGKEEREEEEQQPKVLERRRPTEKKHKDVKRAPIRPVKDEDTRIAEGELRSALSGAFATGAIERTTANLMAGAQQDFKAMAEEARQMEMTKLAMAEVAEQEKADALAHLELSAEQQAMEELEARSEVMREEEEFRRARKEVAQHAALTQMMKEEIREVNESEAEAEAEARMLHRMQQASAEEMMEKQALLELEAEIQAVEGEKIIESVSKESAVHDAIIEAKFEEETRNAIFQAAAEEQIEDEAKELDGEQVVAEREALANLVNGSRKKLQASLLEQAIEEEGELAALNLASLAAEPSQLDNLVPLEVVLPSDEDVSGVSDEGKNDLVGEAKIETRIGS
jgi:hypothetical protein